MSKKFHVLVIAMLFPPDMGGGSTRAFNVVKGLVKHDCYVTVVTAFPHYPYGRIPRRYRRRIIAVEEEEENYRLVRVWVPPLPSKGIVNRLLLFVSFCFTSLLGIPYSQGISVVWAANPNILSFFPAKVYGYLRSSPIVQNVDDLWPEVLVQLQMINSGIVIKMAEFVSKLVYNSADALTPISPSYVSVIATKYGVNLDRLHVVLAGVDSRIFKPKITEEDGIFRVLYIGAFSPAYDFDCVLKAANLLQEHDDIKFVLQGAGEMIDRVYSSVAEMRLSNVEVINKIVSRKEVAETLRSADVLLLPLGDSPSVQQGISSKLYEYQAVGKPIICCSNGMPGKFVSETGSGLIVKPGDYEEVANSILFLKDHIEDSIKFGENGRRFVEDKLSIEKTGLKMKYICESIQSREERF